MLKKHGYKTALIKLRLLTIAKGISGLVKPSPTANLPSNVVNVNVAQYLSIKWFKKEHNNHTKGKPV